MSTDDSAWYVDVPLESDEATLADQAVERLREQWTDWEPNEGDLEVVQIEALASMAAAVAQQASVATEEIFRAFGTQLVGVPYEDGSPATTTVTFVLTDTEVHLVEDGTEIDIDGYAFLTVGDVTNVLGQGQINAVPVECAVIGVEGNGLGISAARISALAFVAEVLVDAPTSGGTDAMSDEDYLGALSRKLQLRADTLVTKRDHEYWALSYPEVGRAYAVHTDDRRVTIYIATDAGEIVSTPTKTQMTTDVLNYRLVNTVTTIADPSYTTITVTYAVHALPGFDLVDLHARIDSALLSWLSPAGFATPKSGDPGTGTGAWVGTNVVRKNVAIDRIGDVEGVDYVDTVTLAIGSGAGAVNGAGDVVMGGTVALPRSTQAGLTGTVSGSLS
jgi:hypothetical protein